MYIYELFREVALKAISWERLTKGLRLVVAITDNIALMADWTWE